MGSAAIVTDCPAVDCLFSRDVPNLYGLSDGLSNSQSDFTKPIASPKMVSQPLSGYEFSDMNRNHKLLVQNRYSPLYELGFDSKEDDMLMLDQDNSTGSGKDEDDRNVLDIVPLSKWAPCEGLDLVTEERVVDDFLVEDFLEPSVWVKRMVKGFGKFVGFPIDSCERQCIAFLQKLEEVWKKQATAGSLRYTTSSAKKGMREFKNLVSAVNYDGQSGHRTRGDVNSIGVGSNRCP